MRIQKLLLTLLIVTTTLSIADAQNWWKNRIKGEGDVEKQTLDVEAFDGFTLAVSANLYVRQGDKHEIVVKAQPNIIDNIMLKMDGDHLKITYDRPVWRSKGITIYMTTPSLDKIGVSGSGNVSGDGKFTNLGELKVMVSGSGNVTFDCEAQSVYAKISGSGNVNLGGSGSSLTGQISGSGNLKAGDMEVADASVKVSGSGNVYVHATESLEASVSGSGDIKYKGRPRLKAKSSGSGNISSI